jgi:hypothetical protein
MDTDFYPPETSKEKVIEINKWLKDEAGRESFIAVDINTEALPPVSLSSDTIS